MKKLFVFVYLLAAFCLLAQNEKIIFVETSDVHGAIYPYDFMMGKDAGGSLARVKTYVNTLRKENNVVLLDNGDILQGTPVVYYYNFVDTSATHLYARVMNYMEYDAASVGNHDIEPGHIVYDKFAKEVRFPWMAANAVSTETGKPYFEPYTIINKAGKKIAVLGMITPAVPNWLPPDIWSGIKFEDLVPSAKKWVKIIRDKHNPDILIGLFHSGAGRESGSTEEKVVENAGVLVGENVPGFDVIFVGHDHRGWNKTIKDPNGKDVIIAGTKSKAKDLAIVEVEFNGDNKTFSSSIVKLDETTPDLDYLNKFEKEFKTVEEYISREIGTLDKKLFMREAVFNNAPIIDLIHKVQLELTGADLSFAAPLSLNATLDKGAVYVKDMFSLYKYENLLYTMELSGKEIKDFLEYSYDLRYRTMGNKDEHLINVREVEKKKGRYRGFSAFKHSYYNFDDAEGIEYTVDVSKHYGERVTIKGFSDGRGFNTDSKYKVALNSYRGSGGGGHLTKGCGIEHDKLASRIVSSTEKDLRFYIMEWIKKEGDIKVTETKNWKVIPEEYFVFGKDRDYKYIFQK